MHTLVIQVIPQQMINYQHKIDFHLQLFPYKYSIRKKGEGYAYISNNRIILHQYCFNFLTHEVQIVHKTFTLKQKLQHVMHVHLAKRQDSESLGRKRNACMLTMLPRDVSRWASLIQYVHIIFKFSIAILSYLVHIFYIAQLAGFRGELETLFNQPDYSLTL